jgi:hypothetical protein
MATPKSEDSPCPMKKTPCFVSGRRGSMRAAMVIKTKHNRQSIKRTEEWRGVARLTRHEASPLDKFGIRSDSFYTR